MRRQMITSFVAASALMLGLHVAAPTSHAASGPVINATCTVYADPAYRSGSTVISSHSIRCSGTVSSITVYATLSGASYRTSSKTCYNTSQCILNLSAPYAPGYWTTRTSGSAGGVSYATKSTSVYL